MRCYPFYSLWNFVFKQRIICKRDEPCQIFTSFLYLKNPFLFLMPRIHVKVDLLPLFKSLSVLVKLCLSLAEHKRLESVVSEVQQELVTALTGTTPELSTRFKSSKQLDKHVSFVVASSCLVA